MYKEEKKKQRVANKMCSFRRRFSSFCCFVFYQLRQRVHRKKIRFLMFIVIVGLFVVVVVVFFFVKFYLITHIDLFAELALQR